MIKLITQPYAQVAVQEDAGCRAHFDWVTGGGERAWDRESG